ncbi:MAG: thiamine pyrophosphate-dependent dehydrogenase E1 component subunit alpha [Kiritimatiellia bacterium]|nr:thiamine pyrophosphate-dependent dehydrogenase E1 component subunit alpha [Kiritimatiellia bacterium]
MKHPSETIERFYRALYRIRAVEEEIARLYPSDKIKSPVHLSIGQEAIAVGVCEALRKDDVVFGTYRGHAMYLAKGGDLQSMLAELYGKVTGCARGKGGSMHLVDPEHGIMGTSAVVATTISPAVGYAYALKVKRSDRIVACFFGDGATDEGAFAESINFAALKKAPVIFICENNEYAIFSHINKRQAQTDIAKRVSACNVPVFKFENSDVFSIFEHVQNTCRQMRSAIDFGPFFYEISTCRWREHVGPNEDDQLKYRDEAKVLSFKKRDEVKRLAEMIDPARRKKIELSVQQEIKSAIAFAESSPWPEPNELYRHVFKEK